MKSPPTLRLRAFCFLGLPRFTALYTPGSVSDSWSCRNFTKDSLNFTQLTYS